MKKSRCLGLVGGLGVGAAVHYYRGLAKAHASQDLALDMVMVHAETDRVFEYLQAGDRHGLAEYMAGFIHRLRSAGAEFVAIPAVTPHFCLGELVGMSPLPILSIMEPIVEEIESRKARRVAVFGTRFVIESKLFGLVGGVEFCQPTAEEIEYIHATYKALAQSGKGTEEQFTGLTRLAHTLQERDKADVILMAGTDLALLFNETNTEFPFIDCAALHIERIFKSMIPEARLSS
jgi:aspartate racemase